MSYLGENIKKLGFGLMRLPKDGEVIDVEQTKIMVDKFLDAGFTYFDSAWAYPGSEEAICKALFERYPNERSKVQFATKNAAWINCNTREDAAAQFETSLRRSGAGYFDFYLLHNLGETRTKPFDDFRMWDFVQEKKKEGLIKHAGFSFHSTPEELEQILTAHPEAEFVQLQINYGDWENPGIRSRECYETARRHGKPVIIMEPVKGGMLATPPESVVKVLKDAEPESSPASWALRFAADLDGLVTVLSGMSSVAQMEENIAVMRNFTKLTDAQRAAIAKAREELAKIPLVPCTVCNYCAKVCPANIGISGTFSAMNMHTLYGNMETAKTQENWLVTRHGREKAVECVKCGACEAACPQHIQIRSELERAAKLFGQEKKG